MLGLGLELAEPDRPSNALFLVAMGLWVCFCIFISGLARGQDDSSLLSLF